MQDFGRLLRLAATIVLSLSMFSCQSAFAKKKRPYVAPATCDLAMNLTGWSSADADYWRDQIERRVIIALNDFSRVGAFRPVVFEMHGNTASITSADIEHVVTLETVASSGKRRAGVVPGTSIPRYEIVTQRPKSQRESRYVIGDLVFRLPVRPSDLPVGAASFVTVRGTCGDVL